jgi:ubiquitin-activating enzyme E1
MSESTKDQTQVDSRFMDLYSRQIGTYGMDTMVRLISLKVAILGCRGVGAEAAKNLALAGVHTVALFDPAKATARDQGNNFAVTEETIAKGQTRAEATAALVSQLNPNTRVRVLADADDSTLAEFDVVILTTGHSKFSKDEIHRVNEACRARTPTGSFIACFNGGANGSVFVDHGANFVTKDPDGRAALQKSIVEVVEKTDKKGQRYTRLRLAVPEGMQPGALRDRTEVTFSDVRGLVHSKSGESIVASKTPFAGFQGLGDPAGTLRIYPSLEEQGYSAYESGGFVHEVKETVIRNFRPFADCLALPPPIIVTDSMMDGTAEKNVHLLLASIVEYGDRHDGALPVLHDAASADEVLALAKEVQARGEASVKAHTTSSDASSQPPAAPVDPDDEMPVPLPLPPAPTPFTVDYFDDEFVKRAASLAAAELQPLSTLLGAVVAQEVVKVTGKFTPIYQFLHLNCTSVLPDEAPKDAPGDDRYSELRALFGETFLQKLLNLKMFMVGCGALGCEYIKNFALTGACCGPNGLLTVTDNDRIEVSNLNRQFLFREDNIGQQKSVAAGNRAKTMNKKLNIDARQDLVADTTEHLFTDEFWQSLDVVTNALDNMVARLYVDERCVLFEKVLVEAGTMGTGGNVDIVVPHKTSTYAQGGAADETGGIPMCTLRNFPYIYDHCIEWARAQFEDLFVAPIMATQQLRENPQRFHDKMKDEVLSQHTVGLKRSIMAKNVKTLLALQKIGEILTRPEVGMAECVQLAWITFHAQFRDRIASLIATFPKTATKRNGEPFWSGHRKFPTALHADLSDADVRDFLISASNCFAAMLGVHGEKHAPVKNDPKNRWKTEYRTEQWLRDAVKDLPAPEVLLTTVDDLDEETSTTAGSTTKEVSDADQEKQYLGLLDAVTALGSKLSSTAQPLDFEKDDDDNFHIDFVAATANLRARNYDIATKDRMAVKLVAGKIIPAIATTTAAVTGIAFMELFKVLQGKDVGLLRNGQIDLGSNNYVLFDRDPPKKVKSYVEKTYDPETDYTLEEPKVAFPNPHTVYDKIVVDVDASSTVEDFVESLQAKTDGVESGPFEVFSIGVGKGMIWSATGSHKATKLPLLQVIAEQMGKDASVFWKPRRLFNKLAVSLETADGDEVIPATIVLRIAAATN